MNNVEHFSTQSSRSGLWLTVQMGSRISSEESKAEAASRARTQAEADAARLREEHRAELEGQRVHYTGLLAKANSAQVMFCKYSDSQAAQRRGNWRKQLLRAHAAWRGVWLAARARLCQQ